jgi:hypothetical protein
LPPRSVILALDETDLLLFPPLRATWSLRGVPAEILLSGRNARRVIFGAMNLRSGTRLFMERRKGCSEDFQAFLVEVRSRCRGWHIALLLDEDPLPHGSGILAGSPQHDAFVAAEARAAA